MEYAIIAIGFIFICCLIPVGIGYFFPRVGGRKLLIRYLLEHGVNVSHIPPAFLEECEGDCHNIAKTLAAYGTRQGFSSAYDKMLQGMAYNIAMMLLPAEKLFHSADLPEELIARAKRYKLI